MTGEVDVVVVTSVSHADPVKSIGQTQNVSPYSFEAQAPPLRHGHGSSVVVVVTVDEMVVVSATSHTSPVNPSGQEQKTKPNSLSSHVPPF